ncbi:hypothetical protein CB1_001511001 [Camelus ferus]|nr:hypothetical protein CB1_001511001 [Camelus ferus]
MGLEMDYIRFALLSVVKVRRRAYLEPWIIVLIIFLSLIVLTVCTGLTFDYARYNQRKTYSYYSTLSFTSDKLYDDFEKEASKNFTEMSQKIESMVKNMFHKSSLRDKFVKSHIIRFRYKDPARWTASFGVTLMPPKIERGLRRIIVHENYKYPSHDYDISVAELSSPVPYTNAVHRICLPDASYEFHPDNVMFVTGFGALRNENISQNCLQQVQVDFIDTETCNQPQIYNNTITPRMLCAGSLKGNRDACLGDSGGPLVTPDARDTWYLAGIVSWGDGCGAPNKPSVYTRVTAFRGWIASKTGV